MEAPKFQPDADSQPDAGIENLAREALDQFLEETDLPDSTMESWRQPFIVARVIQRALLDAGILPQSVLPERFVPVVEDFFVEHGEIDPDEVSLLFPSAWEKVRTPEGENAVSYAAKCARLGKWKADVGLEFQNERVRLDAQQLATAIAILEKMNDDHAFLSTRSAAEILGKSRGYAAQLLRDLASAGVLKAETATGRRLARIYSYVSPEKRTQEWTQDLQDSQDPNDLHDLHGSRDVGLCPSVRLLERLAKLLTPDPSPEDIGVLRQCHDLITQWARENGKADTVDLLERAVSKAADKCVPISRLVEVVTDRLRKFSNDKGEQRH